MNLFTASSPTMAGSKRKLRHQVMRPTDLTGWDTGTGPSAFDGPQAYSHQRQRRTGLAKHQQA